MQNVYSVYDVKAEVFSPPFTTARDGLAIRMFSDIANDRGTQVGKYPGDFKLCCIGSFDETNGVIEGCVPRTIGFATDYIQRGE